MKTGQQLVVVISLMIGTSLHASVVCESLVGQVNETGSFCLCVSVYAGTYVCKLAYVYSYACVKFIIRTRKARIAGSRSHSQMKPKWVCQHARVSHSRFVRQCFTMCTW